MATAEAFDDDLRARIERHRAERPEWPTIEEPVELADAVARLPARCAASSSTASRCGSPTSCTHGTDDVDDRTADLLAALGERPGPSVVISNEVGLGVHPETEIGRRYRDLLGRVNQASAAVAATSLLLVAGRAVELRDPWELLS